MKVDCLIFLMGFWSFGICAVARRSSATMTTRRDAYLAGHVYKKLHNIDWLHCVMACDQEPHLCVSYNFNAQDGECELSGSGVQETCDLNEMLVSAPGFVFQQLRDPPKLLAPRKTRQGSPCDCRCEVQSACSTPSPGAAISCKDIWESRGVRTNGPQYIQGHSSEQKTHVYCHMTELPACGDGGWTLVMKINGAMNTFTYGSRLWTNKTAYNEQAGMDLSHKETKMPTYWTTPFTSLCLGMEHDDTRKWVKVEYAAANLFNVISKNQHVKTNVSVEEWKSLLPNSSLQVNCIQQGFNCNNTAKARIGIIGFSTCRSTSHSRIGFGTAGRFMGMNDSNSCGNEFLNEQSITAFGYIFVK